MTSLACGDDSALGLLIDRWQRPLLSFTYRYVLDHDAAHELTQETFVRLYQSRGRYKPGHKFSSWVFKIASNLCKNYFRWKTRHPEHNLDDELQAAGPLPEALLDNADNPAGAAERGDDARRVAAAVEAMPHGMKVTVLLHYYEGQSYREIASVIGCSERGVETRLYRARAWLAERLNVEDEGEDTSERPQPQARRQGDGSKKALLI